MEFGSDGIRTIFLGVEFSNVCKLLTTCGGDGGESLLN